MLHRYFQSEWNTKNAGLSISIGDTFLPIVWKADFDMDFSSGCLFCGNEDLRGYQVEDEQGISGKVAVCPQCTKVNAKY